MTKDNEIKIFKKAITELTENSYLYESLTSLIHFVESEMKSDFIPDIVTRIKEQQEESKKLQLEIDARKTFLKDCENLINVRSSQLHKIEEQIQHLKNLVQNIQ